MYTDYTKPSHTQVLALINRENNQDITLDQITFDKPVAVTAPTHDTELLVRAIPGRGYILSVNMQYNRINLADFAKIKPARFVTPAVLDLPTLVAAFNTLYGTVLDANDYDPSTPVPASISNEGTVFTLMANPDSYAYQGSIDVLVMPDGIDLVSRLPVNHLTGLDNGIASMSMLLTQSGSTLVTQDNTPVTV
jgi:hypothetical protein